jgi:hypothetical protein
MITVLIDSGWRRVELVPMDAHCGEISVALYRRETVDRGPVAMVHTYSAQAGAPARVRGLTATLAALGGLELAGDGRTVRFPCGAWHLAAAKRLFLEACKLDPALPVAARPLGVTDAKSGQEITVEPLGGGSYRVTAAGVGEGEESRAPAIAGGLAKLAALETATDDPTVVTFPCGHDHDALIGLLLPRALNVRAALREAESASSRGVLVAPSAQEQT